MADTVRAFVVLSKPFTTAWGVHDPGDTIYEHNIADGSAGLGIERLVHLGLLAPSGEVAVSDVPDELSQKKLAQIVRRERAAQRGSTLLGLAERASASAETPEDDSEEPRHDRAPGQPTPKEDPNATGLVGISAES